MCVSGVATRVSSSQVGWVIVRWVVINVMNVHRTLYAFIEAINPRRQHVFATEEALVWTWAVMREEDFAVANLTSKTCVKAGQRVPSPFSSHAYA